MVLFHSSSLRYSTHLVTFRSSLRAISFLLYHLLTVHCIHIAITYVLCSFPLLVSCFPTFKFSVQFIVPFCSVPVHVYVPFSHAFFFLFCILGYMFELHPFPSFSIINQRSWSPLPSLQAFSLGGFVLMARSSFSLCIPFVIPVASLHTFRFYFGLSLVCLSSTPVLGHLTSH